MGRTISKSRHDRLRALERAGLLCQHALAHGGACGTPATISIEETVTDRDPDGQTVSGPHRHRAQYCWRHARSVIAAAMNYGTPNAERTTYTVTTRYACGSTQTIVYHMDTALKQEGFVGGAP